MMQKISRKLKGSGKDDKWKAWYKATFWITSMRVWEACGPGFKSHINARICPTLLRVRRLPTYCQLNNKHESMVSLWFKSPRNVLIFPTLLRGGRLPKFCHDLHSTLTSVSLIKRSTRGHHGLCKSHHSTHYKKNSLAPLMGWGHSKGTLGQPSTVCTH